MPLARSDLASVVCLTRNLAFDGERYRLVGEA